MGCLLRYLCPCSKDFLATYPLARTMQDLYHRCRYWRYPKSSFAYRPVLLFVSPYMFPRYFQSLIQVAIHSPILCFHVVVLWLETSRSLERLVSYQYQATVLITSLIAMNSLACRVFRLLRQLKAGDSQTTRFRDVVSTVRFRHTTQMELDTREMSMREPVEIETVQNDY